MSSIKVLPITGQVNTNADVIKFLRTLADQLEAQPGEIKSALVLVEHNHVVDTFVAGKSGSDNARVVGLLAIAQQEFITRMQNDC